MEGVGGLPREGVLLGGFGVGGLLVGLGGVGAAYFRCGAAGAVLRLPGPSERAAAHDSF